MSQEDYRQPLIDIENPDDGSSIRSDTSNLSISDRVTNNVVSDVRLSIKEWIMISVGALVIISLMAYLLYVIIVSPVLINNKTDPTIVVINCNPQHREPKIQQSNRTALLNPWEPAIDTRLSEYLISDCISHQKSPGHRPCVHPTVVQAAELRALHQNHGFSSSKWLTQQAFSYSDLFEYDVNVSLGKTPLPQQNRYAVSDQELQHVASMIRNDPVRLEKMSKYKIYGAFLTPSLLIEIWLNSDREACPN